MIDRDTSRESNGRLRRRRIILSASAGILALSACGNDEPVSAQQEKTHAEAIGEITETYKIPSDVEAPLQSSESSGEAVDSSAVPPNEVNDSTEALQTTGSWKIDFAGAKDGPIDPAIFNFETGTLIPSYNDEQQYYTDRQENARIENGVLIIEARHESYGEGADRREYTSARITTKNKVNITEGSITVRAKLPDGRGTWPAIWLLSTNEPHTGGQWVEGDNNYYAKNGEIDIVEAVGFKENIAFASAHTYESRNEGTAGFSGYTEVPSLYDEFHDYGLEWRSDELIFSIDGEVYHTISKQGDHPDQWPFTADNEMHLIMNVAVGGSWGGTEGIADDSFPARMEVAAIEYSPLG